MNCSREYVGVYVGLGNTYKTNKLVIFDYDECVNAYRLSSGHWPFPYRGPTRKPAEVEGTQRNEAITLFSLKKKL